MSSTVADLQHLREAIRDAIAEVAYNPVMSDHGGIGYIHEGSAADACYLSMRQCQLAVLIIGKRYGGTGSDGVSVTHNEFRTARDNSVPLITFVDGDVMAFKKVYDSQPAADLWDAFTQMDNPRGTFGLIEEVTGSAVYNGLIQFQNASEVKLRLKQQLAHLMGERLVGTVRPITSDVHEILAEVKALRRQLQQESVSLESRNANHQFYIALRFLLEERNKEYAKFVEKLFGDIEIAAIRIPEATSFAELVQLAGGQLEEVADGMSFDDFTQRFEPDRMVAATASIYGNWALSSSKAVLATRAMISNFEDRQQALRARIQNSESQIPPVIAQVGPGWASIDAEDPGPNGANEQPK